MSTATAHLNARGLARRVRPAVAAALVAAALAGAHAEAPAASGASTATATAAPAYGWPVEPFDRQHPVRANFGDPRISFAGPPTQATVLTGSGSFSFHFGIDIAVPDGTAVYAVRSGTVTPLGARNVQVTSANGFAAQYWHIVPAVHPGQEVVANVTVLGHVQKGYEHVHFTELDHGHAVNPLAAGHLGPYTDGDAPTIAAISFRAGETPLELLPEAVSGRIVPTANVYDMPSLRVAGRWAGLPVAPARITWRIERAADGRVVSPETSAFDVRETIPPNGDFWRYYARGSRQNMCSFHGQRAWRTGGTYLYRLTRGPLDTRTIRNGIYRLVVTASDVRGNSTSQGKVFIIRNGGTT